MQPSIGSFPSWRFSNGKTCHVVMDLPWYWLDLNDFSWDDLTVDYSHFWKNTEQSAGDTFIDDSKVGQIHYILSNTEKVLYLYSRTNRWDLMAPLKYLLIKAIWW